MKVNVEEKSSVQRLMTVEVPEAEVKKTLNNLYKRLGRQAKIKGFRPGKVPRSILEKYYGAQVAAETAEGLMSDYYPKALDEVGLEPLAQPEFDFDIPELGRDFVFKVTLDVKPEFDLEESAYKGLELKEPDLEVTDEEVNIRLDALLERQAVLMDVEEERPAETGDVVVVDYQSFIGDEPVEGGAAENVEIELGKGQSLPEIETALVKAKVGDQLETTVEYGDDVPNKDLAGKEVRFELKVKALKKKVLPALDDDFARSLSPEIESLEMLTEKIREEMEQGFQQQRDSALRKQILDHIRDLGEFDLPATLVTQETEEMVKNLKERLRQSGMDPDEAGWNDERMLTEFRAEAEKKVRAGIVLGRISELENVEASQEDLDAELEKISGRVGQPVDAIRQIYIKNNMMPNLAAQVMEEKTLQAIKAAAKIKKVDPAQLAEENQENAAQNSTDNQTDAK